MSGILDNDTTLELYIGLAENLLANDWSTKKSRTVDEIREELRAQVLHARVHISETQSLVRSEPPVYQLEVFEDSGHVGGYSGSRARTLYHQVLEEINELYRQQSFSFS